MRAHHDSDRKKKEHAGLVSTIKTALDKDGYVVLPAIDLQRLESSHRSLERLVKKDPNGRLTRDNFRGGPISGDSNRLQTIIGNFGIHDAKAREWLAVSHTLGEDVCALLSVLFGDEETVYKVGQPATLLSIGNPAIGTEGVGLDEGTQFPHRDYPWDIVQSSLKRHADGLYRAFGCICALEFATKLRVYPGSHLRTEDEIDFESYLDVDVPRGSLILFRDTLMHCGAGYVLSNLRQHFNVNADNAKGRRSIAPPGDIFKYAKEAKFRR